MDILIKRPKIFSRRDGIIQIWRLPPTKTLRANLFGLTLALVGAFYTIILDHTALFQGLPWYAAPLAIGIFILGTYVGGPFVILTAILFFFTSKLPEVPPQFFSSSAVVAAWYFLFYAIGAVFPTLYNALAFLNVTLCCRKQVQLAFAYDPKKKINIIKAPKEIEELAMLEVLKPVLYYVRKIERAGMPSERQRHAQDLGNLIRQAKSMMSSHDQNHMHELLSEKGIDGELDAQIDTLQNWLASGEPNALELMKSELEHLIEHYLKRKEKKLYHFHLEAPPVAPYTIFLVANPKLKQRSGRFVLDPIMNDLDLFLRSVNNALHSFERDEVLGQHEIWSRVRVVTIFDDAVTAPDGTPRTNDALSLLNDLHRDIPPQLDVAENVIHCGVQMADNVKKFLRDNAGDLDAPLPENQIDVIFAMTASPTQIRHSAYYADFNEELDLNVNPPPQPTNGAEFNYNLDPYQQKGLHIPGAEEIVIPPHIPSPGLPEPFPRHAFPYDGVHDHYSAIPGRVALNALSARRHTFIHEFAHAMSSVVRGAICDEYYDKSYLRAGNDSIFLPFFVNRIERVRQTGGRFVSVHPVFARYNEVDFLSDGDHPSAEEYWRSYFPERHSHGETCTMDRTAEPFRFDKLISRFMYDRLVAKLHRP